MTITRPYRRPPFRVRDEVVQLSADRHVEGGEVELLHALLRLTNQLQSNLDLDAVVRVVATAVSETFGFGEAVVYVREGDLLWVRAATGGDGTQNQCIVGSPCEVASAERIMMETYRVGDVYLVPADAPQWTEDMRRCLAAHPVLPVAPGGWRYGDTLFVPLRDQRRRLAGLLRLGAPVHGNRPGLDVVASLGVFAAHAAVAIANAREHEQLQQVTRELEKQLEVRRELLEASRTLLGTLDEAMVFGRISHMLDSLLDFDAMGIGLIDRAQGVIRPAYLAEEGVLLDTGATLPLDEPVIAALLHGDEPAVIVEGAQLSHKTLVPGTTETAGPTILASLAAGGEPFGLLAVARHEEPLRRRPFGPYEAELVQLVANMAAIALQNARSYKEILHLASSDELTGIHNYRHFRETLTMEVRRADRYAEAFCLLMMDLDHFKAVNDTVGHQQGDEVLRAVGGILRQCSRESDYLARYGGEEFVMILPRTGLAEARTVAERIRSRVREIDPGSPALTVSMSIGVAAYPQTAADADGVLRAADVALLRAKAAGRNRVCLYAEGAAEGGEGIVTPQSPAVSLGRHFARTLGLDEQETAGLAAALAVLTGAAGGQERPAALLPPEGSEAAAGAMYALLSSTERWDGTGYPEGLRGRAIPRVGRVLAVLRAYLACGASETREASRYLWRLAGDQLDPGLVQRFIACLAAVEGRKAGHRAAAS